MSTQDNPVGLKFDSEKSPMALLPLEALEEIAKVLQMGANKYGKFNWRFVDDGLERYESALLRHLAAIHRGESIDPESNLSHYVHAACNAIFLVAIEMDKQNKKENK
jgi:hypothetical protein